MESARYLRYRAETPMVIIRPVRIIERSKNSKSILVELNKIEFGRKMVRWLPLKMIEVWKYQERGENVIEIELPRWLAEKEGIVI